MFPSTLSTFNRPQSTDRLNSPSHSALHNTVSSALGQVEAVIGVDGTNSVLGTIIGDLRSPGSSGGGHVQTANKGGTGQTTYTKGDMLVATSSSVLAKFAIGADGQIAQVNSSMASGFQYVNNPSPKIFTSVIGTTFGVSTVSETSIFSTTVPASVLGTNNAIRVRVLVDAFNGGQQQSVLLRMNYGTTAVPSVMLFTLASQTSVKGYIEQTIIAAGATNSQIGRVIYSLSSVTALAGGMMEGSSSVLSDVSQNIGMTIRYGTSDAGNGIKVAGVIVEKIV